MGDQDPKRKRNKGKDKVPEPESMDSVYARWSGGLVRQYGSWEGNLSAGASGAPAPRNPGPSGPANPGQNAPRSAPVPNLPPHGPPEGQLLAAAPGGGSTSSHGVDRRGRQRKAAPASRKKATTATATAKEPSARRAGTARTRTKRVRDSPGQNAPPSAPVVRKPRGRPKGQQHGEASREPLAVQSLPQPQPGPDPAPDAAPDLDADNEIGWCWGCGLRPAEMRPQPLMHVCACDTCRIAVCWFCDPDQQPLLLQHGDDVPQLQNQPVVANCPVEQHGEAPVVQLGHPGLPPPPQAHPVLPADQPVAGPGPVPVADPNNEFGSCCGCGVRPAGMRLQPWSHVCACDTCCFVVCEVCSHDL